MNWLRYFLFIIIISLNHSVYAYNAAKYLLPLQSNSTDQMTLLSSTADLLTWTYYSGSADGNNGFTINNICYLQFSIKENIVKSNRCLDNAFNFNFAAQTMLNDKEVIVAIRDLAIGAVNEDGLGTSYTDDQLLFYKLDISNGQFTQIANFNIAHTYSIADDILKKIKTADGEKFVFASLGRNTIDQSSTTLTIFSSNDGKNWQQNAKVNTDDVESIDNLSYINTQYVLTTYSQDDEYPKILISNDLMHWQLEHLTNINKQYEDATNTFYIFPPIAGNNSLIASHFAGNFNREAEKMDILNLSYFQSLDNGQNWSNLTLQLPVPLIDPSSNNNYTCNSPWVLDEVFSANNGYILDISCYSFELNYNADPEDYALNKKHEALLLTSNFNLNSSTTTLAAWDTDTDAMTQFCQQAKDSNDRKVYCLGDDNNHLLLTVFD